MDEQLPPRHSLPRRLKREGLLRKTITDKHLEGIALSGSVQEELSESLAWMFVQASDPYLAAEYDQGSQAMDTAEAQERQRRLRTTIDQLLLPFHGRLLQKDGVNDMARLIAGFWDDLCAGRDCRAWDGVTPAWAQLYVRDVERLPVDGRYFRVAFVCTEGSPVLRVWSDNWSGNRLQLLIREAGCPKFAEYRDEDVSGLYFTAIIQASRRMIVCSEVCFSSSEQAHNKRLQRLRKAACPGTHPANLNKPCGLCPLGREQCPAARFDPGWTTIRECVNGHPGYCRGNTKYCLGCLTTGRF